MPDDEDDVEVDDIEDEADEEEANAMTQADMPALPPRTARRDLASSARCCRCSDWRLTSNTQSRVALRRQSTAQRRCGV